MSNYGTRVCVSIAMSHIAMVGLPCDTSLTIPVCAKNYIRA